MPEPFDTADAVTTPVPAGHYHILVVCTANECRSPLAATFLSEHLRRAGVSADVKSAGVHATLRSARPEIIKVAAEYDFDLTAHVSQRLVAPLVEDADLVLGLTREHVRETVVLSRGAWNRTFTLKELVRRTSDRARRNESLAEWLAVHARRRTSADLLGSAPEDDVEDPVGRPRSVVRRTAAELDVLTSALVRVAWP